MENQTSIEWIEDKINNYDFNQGIAQMRKYILQAKQMEKEQIMMAYNDGRINQGLKQNKNAGKYYNETYGN